MLETEAVLEDDDDRPDDEEVFAGDELAEDALAEDGLVEDEVSRDELLPIDDVAPDRLDAPELSALPALPEIELLEPLAPPASAVRGSSVPDESPQPIATATPMPAINGPTTPRWIHLRA